LSIWVDKWFKVSFIDTYYQFNDIGVKPTPGYLLTSRFPAYLKITGWNPSTRILSVNVYAKDNMGWNPNPFFAMDLNYFAGSDLKVVCSTSVDLGWTQFSYVLVFIGKRKANGNFVLDGITYLKTLGGYYFENDVPNSPALDVGGSKLQGNMIPLSKVPEALR
jgi:hypothetical protein